MAPGLKLPQIREREVTVVRKREVAEALLTGSGGHGGTTAVG
jgi:hypothetical protein